MSSTISRVTNRAKRQVMARFGPVNRIVHSTHEARLRDHRPNLPMLSPKDSDLVARQEVDGVVVTSLDELDLPNTAAIKEALGQLVQSLSDAAPGGDSTLRPTHQQILENIELWQWGLSHRLLDIVENHIGLPVRYHGADMRREVANGKAVGVRQWHRDIEDHRVFKILVWLNDVGPSGGPFEYVELPQSLDAVRRLKYVSGFVTDDSMDQVIPRDQWHQATGPKWTAVVPDTAQVFHRAMPATDRDRYSVTFTWTSRHQIKVMPSEPFTASETARIRVELDARQLECLPPAFQG